jgi:coproporphyrinogen III oxidase
MSLTISTAILKNSILQKTSINIINNHIIKNRCLYSTENGPKIEIPNLQTKDLINNSENKNTDTDKPTPKLFDDKKPLSDEPLNKTIDNSETKSSTEKKSGTIPITKKENKKSSSSGNNYNKYYLYATLGLFQLIPLYYFFKKRRTLNDYNSSDVKRVKRVQKSYDSNMRQQMATYLYSIQNDIIRFIEETDTKVTFSRSNWNQRSKNSTGGGTTCNFENGKIFEKAVVQVNIESGSLSPFQIIELLTTRPAVQIISKSLNDKFSYYKASLSSILYPQNPNIPTSFLDLAYNEVKNNSTGKTYWWFSGGNDFSDTNVFMTKQEDLSSAVKDNLLSEFYQKFKEDLDQINPEYFDQFIEEGKQVTFISHRDEMRGVGGLYFNDLNDTSPQSILTTIIPCFAQKTFEYYKPIIEKRNKISWTLSDKEKQAIKNSRLVEFELVSKLDSKVDDSSSKNIDKTLPILPLNVSWKKNEIVNDN